MRKVEVMEDVYCDSQILLVYRLEKLKLLQVEGVGDFFDPVTEKYLGTRFWFLTPWWFENILRWLFYTFIDPEGQEKIELLMRRGLVSAPCKTAIQPAWKTKIILMLGYCIFCCPLWKSKEDQEQ